MESDIRILTYVKMFGTITLNVLEKLNLKIQKLFPAFVFFVDKL